VEDVQVFELGRVFRADPLGGRPEERRALGIAMMGRWRRGWNIPAEQAVVDFFHMKGVIEALLEEMGVSGVGVEPLAVRIPGWWHPGRAAAFAFGGSTIGRLGEMCPDLGAAHRLSHRAYLAEVDLEALLPVVELERASPDLPRYPAVERDVAAVIPDRLPAGRVEAAIRDAAGPLLEAVELFDVYTGPPVPDAHRNLAYRLRLRAPDRTLTVRQVRIALQKLAGVRLRE
jgi:phenylalanyl-tRNA synthetase beta chain